MSMIVPIAFMFLPWLLNIIANQLLNFVELSESGDARPYPPANTLK